jgi:hypothetical protein
MFRRTFLKAFVAGLLAVKIAPRKPDKVFETGRKLTRTGECHWVWDQATIAWVYEPHQFYDPVNKRMVSVFAYAAKFGSATGLNLYEVRKIHPLGDLMLQPLKGMRVCYAWFRSRLKDSRVGDIWILDDNKYGTQRIIDAYINRESDQYTLYFEDGQTRTMPYSPFVVPYV